MSEERFVFGDILDEAGPELERQIEADKSSSGQFDLVPTGYYRAEMVKAEPTAISGNGNGGTKMTWKVTEGLYMGRLLFGRIYYTPSFSSDKARDNFFRKFAAMGITPEIWKQQPTQSQIEAMIVGSKCIVTVKHDPGFNDASRIYASVAWVAPDRGGPVPVAKDKPATASGAFGGVPSTATPSAPVVSIPVPNVHAGATPNIPTPNIPGQANPGMPAGLG